MLLVPHKLLPPPGGCFGVRPACYFPCVIISLVLCLALFTSSGVFFLFIFSQLVFYQVLATSPAGPRARQIVSSTFVFHFCFLFLFRFVFIVFVFSLIVSFCFFISHNGSDVRVVSSMMTWHCIAHSGAVHTANIRGNVVSLWRSVVTI